MPARKAATAKRATTPVAQAQLPWVLNSSSYEPNKIRILIVGHENVESFIEALHGKVVEEGNLVQTFGCSPLSLEILKIDTLVDDVAEVSKKKIDYILVMLNTSDPTYLDRADLECAHLHIMFLARRRVEFCLWKDSPSIPEFFSAEIRSFASRLQNPTISAIRFDDPESVKHGAEILYRRLRQINIVPGLV